MTIKMDSEPSAAVLEADKRLPDDEVTADVKSTADDKLKAYDKLTDDDELAADDKLTAELLKLMSAASVSRSAYRQLARTILKDLEQRDSWQRRVSVLPLVRVIS
jgi:hypothetical protein